MQVNLRVPTLAVKLAKESYFGKRLMRDCTVKGTREQPALHADRLEQLKEFLRNFFSKMPSHEFEGLWRQCIDSIGQACKSLRKKPI